MDMKFASVCAVAAVLFAGCASNNQKQVTSASQERYFMGTYTAVMPYSMMTLDRAVLDTCQQAHLLLVSKQTSATNCIYLFKDINNIPLEVTIQEKPDRSSTSLRLHVGRFGDKATCQELLKAIDEAASKYKMAI